MELVFGPSVDVGRQAVIGKKETIKMHRDRTAQLRRALQAARWYVQCTNQYEPFFLFEKVSCRLAGIAPFWCFVFVRYRTQLLNDQSVVD